MYIYIYVLYIYTYVLYIYTYLYLHIYIYIHMFDSLKMVMFVFSHQNDAFKTYGIYVLLKMVIKAAPQRCRTEFSRMEW